VQNCSTAARGRIVAQGLHQVYEGLVGSERLHGFINRFQAIEHQAEPKQNDPELFQRIRLTYK